MKKLLLILALLSGAAWAASAPNVPPPIVVQKSPGHQGVIAITP